MEPQNPSPSSSAPRRKRHSVAEKKEILSAFDASGLTQKEFCAQHGISVATLAVWRKKLSAENPPGFIRLDLPPPRGEASVHFPNGVELRVPCDAAPEWIAELCGRLHQVGGR